MSGNNQTRQAGSPKPAFSMSKAVEKMLGIIFLSAAVFRVINYPAAELEISALGLPGPMAILVIVLELSMAACFLTHSFIKHAPLWR